MTRPCAGTTTFPLPNGQMPAMALNSVDLPEPAGPETRTRTPGPNLKPSAATNDPPSGRVAVEQRDLLGIFARAHEIEAEIGLIALLIEVERCQRAADHMGQQRSGNRIDQRRPEQKARNPPAEQRKLRIIGKRPKNDE